MYLMHNEISFTRAGRDGKLKLDEAVALMTDCCQFQEFQEDEFRIFLAEQNIAVFLNSIQLDIRRMPEFREKIVTSVKIYGCKSIYGLRQLTISDESGEVCVIANAVGAFFNIRENRAVKIDAGVLPVKFDAPLEMECLPRKISLAGVGSWSVAAPVAVTLSGLDPNAHLTSHRYFAIAGDILPEDYSYNRVRMEYKMQAKCGDVIYPYYSCCRDRFFVDMKSSSGVSCAVAEFSTADLSCDRA